LAGADLLTLSTILKEYYQGPVVEQLNKEVLLLSRLESKSEDLVGKRAYVPLQASRTTGIGARAENADLPAAGNYSYDKAVYDLKYLYGKASVSGPSMAKTKSEAGAFLQALKSELDGLALDLRKDLSRQIYGDGTGTIATIDGVPAANVVTLDSAEPLAKGQIYVGMLLDAFNGTTKQTTSGPVEVTAVDIANVQITVDDDAELADTDVLVRAGVNVYAAAVDPTSGNPGTYALSDEVDGLKRIVSATAALGGIDPTASGKEWWKAQSVAATNSGWSNPGASLDDIQQALNKARIAGGYPTAIVTSLGVQRLFYNSLTDVVRYNDPGSLTYEAGFKTLMYNGMPLIADIDAPWGQMYILDESTLKVYSDQDFHFLDADGQTLRQEGNKDAFSAYMVRYMNMGATRRNNQIVITGITADANGY